MKLQNENGIKPIQKYSKQEKLTAISEYSPSDKEVEMITRYLLAVHKNDTEQIAYFESFGDSVRVIILNVLTYERGLLFGYTTKKFDKYGWIRGMLPIIKKIELDRMNAIYIGQSKNGMYAVTVDWSTGGAGGGSYPSVWNEPMVDFKEAVKQGITELEEKYAYAWNHISDSCNYNERKIRLLISKLKEIKLEFFESKQLSLF